MGRPGLSIHRKFRRLARALGSAIVARGVLELMWDAAYESGDIYIGTADDLAAAVGWTDDPDTLARALADSGQPEGQGFIEPIPTADGAPRRFRIHDLWHHAPDYVKKRHSREMDRRRRSAPDGAESGRLQYDQAGDGRTPSPSPAPSPAQAPSPVEDISPVLLVFPTVGPGGSEWRLRRRQVDEWQAAYPSLQVEAECRRALSWVNANTGHRKTAKGMPKFLNGWLARANDRGGGAYAGPAAKSAGNLGSLGNFARGGSR